jgi:hypothetical protein
MAIGPDVANLNNGENDSDSSESPFADPTTVKPTKPGRDTRIERDTPLPK